MNDCSAELSTRINSYLSGTRGKLLIERGGVRDLLVDCREALTITAQRVKDLERLAEIATTHARCFTQKSSRRVEGMAAYEPEENCMLQPEWCLLRAKLFPPPQPVAKFEVGQFVISATDSWASACKIKSKQLRDSKWQYSFSANGGIRYLESDLRPLTDEECGPRGKA